MLVNSASLRLLRFAGWRLVVAVLTMLAAAVLQVTSWLWIATMIGGVFAGQDPAETRSDALIAASLVLTAAAAGWLRAPVASWTAAGVKARLRAELTGRLVDLGPGYTVTHRTGTIQATLTQAVESVDGYVGFYVPHLITAVVVPLGLVGWMFSWAPAVASVVGVSALMVLTGRQLWQRLIGDRFRSHWEAYAELTARIHDTLAGMSTLKLLGAGERVGERLAATSAALYRATMGTLRVGMGVYLLTGAFLGLGTGVAIRIGAFSVADGALAAGAGILVVFVTVECFRPVPEAQDYWFEGFGGITAAGAVLDFLQARPAVTEPSAPVPLPATRPVELKVCDVSFSYPDAERPAVRSVSLTLRTGRTVALVGRSGSGKSTLAALIMRLIDPGQGAVTVNGIDLRRLPLDAVRGLFSVVGQDTYLFHGTVADNLRMADPDAADRRLQEAARRAGIHDTITSWPAGYRTMLGERGVTVSGGERQRIAIARALLRDAPILILDEATANVDAFTEAELHDSLAELARGRATLVIAHRLSSIAHADEVLVLDDGELAERGTLAELHAADGAWRALVAAQLDVAGSVTAG